MTLSRTPAILLPLALLAVVAPTGCNSSSPADSVKLKRGAAVRVINLTNERLLPFLGDRPVACANIDAKAAPFVLVPPSQNLLQLTTGLTPLEEGVEIRLKQSVDLEAGGIYTLIVQGAGKNLSLTTFAGDPPVGRPSPKMRVHNLTSGPVSLSSPEKVASLVGGGSTNSLSIPAAAFKVSGKAGTRTFESEETAPANDGAYVAVVYDDHGAVKAKVFHSNPPMQVVGAPR